jgi:two-component system chemotaxis sensor kinase CheA
MQNMLRPIVEAVGYRVVGDEHDGDADLVITSEPKPSAKGARTIVLRSDPEAAGESDESIYRYDRAGLLMALKAAGGKR